MEIRIAGLVQNSIVDGEGIRFAVFVQGCPHHCKGCHNPQTWDPRGGTIADTDDIFEQIASDPILDGVTFSGGEPFAQARPLVQLADRVRAELPKLNIMVYTGYTFEELIEKADPDNAFLELLKRADYLVDGPYIAEKRSLELKFMGSSNQRFLNVPESLAQNRPVPASLSDYDFEIKLF